MSNDDSRLRYGEGPRHVPDMDKLPWPVLSSTQESEPHEYEMGDVLKPMHTDPMCSVCGAPRSDKRHR